MPKHADEPLKKVTLNLYVADVETMERLHGWGWSEIVRQLIRRYLQDRRHDQ